MYLGETKRKINIIYTLFVMLPILNLNDPDFLFKPISAILDYTEKTLAKTY